MTRGQLRIKLDKLGQDTRGTKPILIERLKALSLKDEITASNSAETAHSPPVMPDSTKEPLVDYDVRSCSSVSSSIFSEKAQLAGLKAKAACLRQKHDLERQAQEIQAMQETLEVEMQIKELSAREAALQAEDNFNASVLERSRTPPSIGTDSLEEARSDIGRANRSTHNARNGCRPLASSFLEGQDHFGSSFEFARRLHLPTLEMQTFDGDIGTYRCFMRAFHSNIAAKVSDEEERLHYLYQYTSGRPRELVTTCLHLPPSKGFSEAMRLLEQRYGSPVQVAARLVDNMLQCSSIRAEDVESLETFAIHLRGSLNALTSLPHGAGAIDVKTIRSLLEKVPFFMRDKWRVRVDEIEQVGHRQAEFQDFVEFVEREARIASNPSYGRHVCASNDELKYGRNETKPQPRSNSRGKLLAGNIATHLTHLSPCIQCNQSHEVSECPELCEKKREEKINFIYANRLCFGCMLPDHVVKHCKGRKTCSKCKGLHPTVLHQDQINLKMSPVVTSGHLASRGGAKLNVVPVRVMLYGVTTLTSAFLDSGSTHSFISQRLLKTLGFQPFERTAVTLSTISADQRLETCVVSQVIIEDLDRNNRQELPPLFVLGKIPVTDQDAPDARDISKYQYLVDGGVSLGEVVEGEVGLLIGNNVAAVTEPLEVVPSQDGGPFAVKTRFGWILGGTERVVRNWCKLNHTHLFVDDDQYGNRAEYRTGLSAEDVRWHSIVENSCRLQNHQYEIALPFRSVYPCLPNNRFLAQKRL